MAVDEAKAQAPPQHVDDCTSFLRKHRALHAQQVTWVLSDAEGEDTMVRDVYSYDWTFPLINPDVVQPTNPDVSRPAPKAMSDAQPGPQHVLKTEYDSVVSAARKARDAVTVHIEECNSTQELINEIWERVEESKERLQRALEDLP
jgi:hypothetical protein